MPLGNAPGHQYLLDPFGLQKLAHLLQLADLHPFQGIGVPFQILAAFADVSGDRKTVPRFANAGAQKNGQLSVSGD